MYAVKLSICIATYNRARYIGETLASIVPQLCDEVEVVVVDGASPDDTQAVVAPFCTTSHPRVRYIREATNSGVDQDYDKAVGYATGEYCWLMTDDDLLVPAAVRRVLRELDDSVDLVVVNSKVKDAHLSRDLRPRMLDVAQDQRHGAPGGQALFEQVANYLSFIGGVIVRRSFWASRERAAYYGTQFIHIGVLFQQPSVERAVVLAEPLIVIRYGNAMWSASRFEIWMFKWPQLIWSFHHFSTQARSRVTVRYPFRNPKKLFYLRGIGSYSGTEYAKFLRERLALPRRVAPALIAAVPLRVANFLCGAYWLLHLRRADGLNLYDLARADHASRLTRRVAQAKSSL